MKFNQFTPLNTFYDPEKAMVLDRSPEIMELLDLLLQEPFGELYHKRSMYDNVPMSKKLIEAMVNDGTIRRRGLKPLKELHQDLTVGDIVCLINEDLKLRYSAAEHSTDDMCWFLSLSYNVYVPNYQDLLKEVK